MRARDVQPSGVERFFSDNELIVSKTDLTGKITYANEVFIRVSGFSEEELIGRPHSLIRHPDMPRSVFKLLWDTIEKGEEIFAYVINMAKNGDHYWVFAHVTPTFDSHGKIVSYHSNRRVPDPKAVAVVKDLYRLARLEEMKHQDPRAGMRAGLELVTSVLQSKGVSYHELIFSL